MTRFWTRFFNQFIRGFWAPAKAAKIILTTPKILVLVLVPLAINILLYALFFHYGWNWLSGLIDSLGTSLQSYLPSQLAAASTWILRVLGWITLIIVAAISFTIVSGIIAAPFNDYLCKQTLKTMYLRGGGKYPMPQALDHTFLQTISLELKRTLVLIFGGLFALVLGIIPLMQFVAIGLGALLISFEYFGYPVSHQSSTLSSVGKFTLRHMGLSLGFGSFMLLLMVIPFATIIYIPVAVVAGSVLFLESQS